MVIYATWTRFTLDFFHDRLIAVTVSRHRQMLASYKRRTAVWWYVATFQRRRAAYHRMVAVALINGSTVTDQLLPMSSRCVRELR